MAKVGPGMSPLKRFFAVSALLSASLIFCALMLEVGVLVMVGPQARFPRHVVGAPWGLRINEPNAIYRHKSADVTIQFRINSRGLRADQEYPYEKPIGTKRILSIGDSFTVGYEVDVEEIFSSIMERELNADGGRVEVLNAGVSGFSNAEAALYLERELYKYDPDIVMLNFFINDLVDNMRTGLFRLEGDELVLARHDYVPGGKIGDFLNTNPVFNYLSGYSNAMAFFKERLNLLAKNNIVAANVEEMNEPTGAASGSEPRRPGKKSHRKRVAAAVFERIYQRTREMGIPFLIQSIPVVRPKPDRLVDQFPAAAFDLNREGIVYFSAKTQLDALYGKELLYHRNSHGHWTPKAHEVAGRELARLVRRKGLLD